MGRVKVYVSALFDSRWERRTGIARVEHEIAREFLTRGGGIVTYSDIRRCLVDVDYEELIRPIVDAQDRDIDLILDAEPDARVPVNGTYRSRALAAIAPVVGGRTGAGLLGLAAAGLTPSARRRVADRLNLHGDPSRAIQFAKTQARSTHAGRQSPRGSTPWMAAAAGLRPGDVIIIPGLMWKRRALEEIARLQREAGVRVMAYVHDLIPLRHPEYHTDANGVDRFRRYIETLLGCCERFFVNSRFVAADLQLLMRERGLAEVPVHVVPLCADISTRTMPRTTRRLERLALGGKPYALYVSTFNPRKNQAGAYLLWRRLLQVLGDRLPPLVLAGQRGWHSGDILRQMARDEVMWGRHIHFVEAPSDTELAQLYANCAFTIFPSLYEGFGMGISEALEFAKPCIAGDNTAQREAGLGLAAHLDVLDGPAWVSEVCRLTDDADYREAWVARIKQLYRRRTWSDVGREMHGILADLAATPVPATSDARSQA